MEEDAKHDLAKLRQQLRHIETEISSLRNETRRFRHVGFGRDIKDMQLMALEEERDLCLVQIAELERRVGKTRSQKRPLQDWLIVPIALLLIGLQALQAGRDGSGRERSRRAPSRAKSIPEVKLSVPDYSG